MPVRDRDRARALCLSPPHAGGEISGYTEMLAESRTQAEERLLAEARQLGADAVVNIRYTTSAVMQGMSEMLAYGTAVKLERA